MSHNYSNHLLNIVIQVAIGFT